MEVVTENLTLLANTLGLKESLGQLDLQAVSLQFGNIILGRPDFSLCLFIYTLVCVSAITKVLKPLKNFWLHDVVYCILVSNKGSFPVVCCRCVRISANTVWWDSETTLCGEVG